MFGNRLIKSNNAGAACTTDTVQILDGTPLESIATYQLDGAATSIPNNTYPGTFTNPSYVTGKFGQAAEFNGSNSYIDLGSNLGIANNSFSFSLWIANRATTTNSYFIGAGTQANNQGLHVGRRATSGKFTFAFYANDLDSNTSMSTNGTWEHWACTYDATTNSRKIYYNGVLDASDTASADFQSTSNVNLGLAPGNDYAYGELDQVRIFNTALSAGAVTSLYNETVATASNSYINLPSCVAYYKMSDATDETGSYDGTPTNVNFNVAGKFGNAGEFNGSSSKILPSSSPIPSSGAFTVSAWVKTSISNHCFISFGDFWLKSEYLSGVFSLGDINTSFQGTTDISDGNWHHCVLTVDASNNIVLYVDGVSEDTGTATISRTNGGSFVIGVARNSNPVYYWNGSIDQVRIFNRAITSNEVETLYNEVECIPTIVPTDYFEPVIYAGNGTTQSISSLDFQPDLVWIKSRSGIASHSLQDTVRGAGQNYNLYSDNTAYEGQYGVYGYLSSFDTNGFEVIAGAYGDHSNKLGENYVAWNWKAGGDDVQNTDGTITSQVSANVDAGFSIVSYTGNSSSYATIGHGLNEAPQLIISKALNLAAGWPTMFNDSSSAFYGLRLNDTGANNTGNGNAFYSNTAPTSSLYTVGGSDEINDNYNYIAYCFHSVDGFSKIGSYVGTGVSGNSIVTGFRPAFVMVKKTNAANDWIMLDSKRKTDNPINNPLRANTSGAETPNNTNSIDFNSNGFTIVGTAGATNTNGDSYIFMAFAEENVQPEPELANSFNVVTYTGNGSTQAVTGLGFQPDLVWIKPRSFADNHVLSDSVRGINKSLASNTTSTENSLGITSFDSNGFSLPSWGNVTSNGNTFVAWAWKASNDSTINQDGTIDSIVSANPAAGFSVVKYTGTGANATVGHGLSSAPEMVIVKGLTTTYDWVVYHSDYTDATYYQTLNKTNAQNSAPAVWNSTAPSSTNISLGSNLAVNSNNVSHIAYCFHSVDGYQKVGSFNYSDTSVTTDFKPRFIMIKRTDNAGSWNIFDYKINTGDVWDNYLRPNTNQIEASGTNIFTVTDTGFNINYSFPTNSEYIYLAIA